jgi:hypothetical protein
VCNACRSQLTFELVNSHHSRAALAVCVPAGDCACPSSAVEVERALPAPWTGRSSFCSRFSRVNGDCAIRLGCIRGIVSLTGSASEAVASGPAVAWQAETRRRAIECVWTVYRSAPPRFRDSASHCIRGITSVDLGGGLAITLRGHGNIRVLGVRPIRLGQQSVDGTGRHH